MDFHLDIGEAKMENKNAATTQHFHKVERKDELTSENYVTNWIQGKLCLVDPWYQLILKMMKSAINGFQGKRVLEVGCGLGGFCIHIAKEDGESIGLDISRSAIQKAKDLVKQFNVQNNIEFIIGDARFVPFKDQSYNIVICSETLEHVEDYEQAFNEIVRVVENSGHIGITVPNLLSTMFPAYIILLIIGQPQHAKKFLRVEKEHIFHYFKIKNLFRREDLKVMKIRSTDFLYIPPRIKKFLKIEHYLKVISDSMEDYLEHHNSALKFLGANIGVFAQKIR